MSSRSLVRRLVLAILLCELLCVIALLAISIQHEHSVRLRAIDVALEGRADSLFGAVQDAEDAGAHVMLDPREMVLPRGDLFAVLDAGGRIIGSSGHLPPELMEPDSAGLRSRRFGHRQYRVLLRKNLRIIDRAESGGAGVERPVTIVYATPLDRLWRQVFAGIGFYLAASLLLIAGTTVLMIYLTRLTLAPLGELAAATAAVTPRELHFQVPPSAMDLAELRPLAATLASVLDQLQVAFQRQHRFLGDAAHELKTAVAVVRSSLQLLLLRPRTAAEYQRGIENLVRDNARTEELISRMLLLARLEEPSSRPVAGADLCATAIACMDRLRPLLEQCGVRLEASLLAKARCFGPAGDVSAPCLPTAGPSVGEAIGVRRCLVPLESADLETLLSNLLINALEYSPRGGVVQLVVSGAAGVAELRVIDHGEGIPAEAQAHLFERFYRADTSRARTTGGAGLGLAICKAIAERAGGSIAIESRAGEGTTAIVTLPLVWSASSVVLKLDDAQ